MSQSPEVIAQIALLHEDGMSFTAIGEALGLSKDQAQGIYKHHIKPYAPPVSPDVKLTDYTKTVEVVVGDVAIAACVHVPEVDRTMWERLLRIGERDALPTLILAGDIVAGDMFSKWLSRGQKLEWGFDAELATLRDYLRSALNVYERIVILPGNHIRNRIVRISAGHIGLSHLILMTGLKDSERERILTTDLDYVTLASGSESFLVAHSAEYSKIDGRVPVQYAEKYEAHVIAGNGHRTGHQVSRSGKWHGWDIGTLANPNYMSYANATLSLYPRMLKSFATVRGGAVRIYGEGTPLTDWSAELPV